MHMVVRTYSGKGVNELVDLLNEDGRKKEVQDLMRAINGFESYTFARSGDGACSVTVCRDKAGTDASIRVAKEYIAKTAKTAVGAPTVAEGSVIVQVR
jgi:hypothetical protein